jgi:cytochrome P450
MDDVQIRAIPAHVPPELVYDYDFFATPALFEAPQWDVAKKLFKEAPPIFFTPLNGGHWVVTRAADIVEMCRDPVKFSSNPDFNYKRKDYPTRNLPAFYDPPEHADGRRLAASMFTPASVAAMEPQIRDLAKTLIEDVYHKGTCEFVHDIAHTFPVTIFLQMANAPLDDRAALVEMANRYTRGDIPTSISGMRDLGNFLTGMVEERRKNPGTDLISLIVKGTLLGKPLTHEQALGAAVFMFMAGLDTVASLMSFIQLFLARNPDHYRQLVEHPERITDAMEELTRVSGVVVMERGVRTENVYKGITFKQLDRVVLLLPIAGMDPHEVQSPEVVDFSRDISKHLVFGSGIHRCLGSHLARTEIRIFLEEWVKRIPAFNVVGGGRVPTFGGTVWMPEKLPLEWKV